MGISKKCVAQNVLNSINMTEANFKKVIEPKKHHKQLNICNTRPAYRQGRKLRAVKVYTINDESQHLLFFGVPSLKLMDDLKRTCSKFGVVKSVKLVPNYPDLEEFTEVYHVHYLKLASARFAKKLLDATSFFGGVLHICYAPELESVNETRAKLIHRRKEVHFKLMKLKQQRELLSKTQAKNDGKFFNDFEKD